MTAGGICDSNGVIVDTKDDEGGHGIRLVLDVTTLYTYTKNTNASTREIFKNGSIDDEVFVAVGRRFSRTQGNAIAPGAYGSNARIHPKIIACQLHLYGLQSNIVSSR